MKLRHLILILLIPFSESKAIFYNMDMAVSWYLFSDHERQICMVIKDYCDIIIFGIVFYFLAFLERDKWTIEISKFLFVLNVLDFIHLGLMDKQYFVIAKLVLTYSIYYLWSKLKPSC